MLSKTKQALIPYKYHAENDIKLTDGLILRGLLSNMWSRLIVMVQ